MYHPIDMSIPQKSFNTSFSVNTLLNQTSSEKFRIPIHQPYLFSSLFQHYSNPITGFRSSTTDSSAFTPAGKRFKANSYDEKHCSTSSDESSGKSSRSSTIDLQNPQCPICQIILNPHDMITHVQQELDLIEHRKQVLQDNNNNHNITQTFKTRYETFLRVRTSRQQRLNGKLQIHPRRSIRPCQMMPINSNEEYFFTHIQPYSRKKEQLTKDDPDVNVVDIEDESTSLSCQESFNSDQTMD